MTYEMALQALADPSRRSIFESLRAAPQRVTEIADKLPISRPAVSQHLKVLQEAGLVRSRPKGTARIYAVRLEGLADLRRYLDSFWDDVLCAYSEEVLRQEGGGND